MEPLAWTVIPPLSGKLGTPVTGGGWPLPVDALLGGEALLPGEDLLPGDALLPGEPVPPPWELLGDGLGDLGAAGRGGAVRTVACDTLPGWVAVSSGLPVPVSLLTCTRPEPVVAGAATSATPEPGLLTWPGIGQANWTVLTGAERGCGTWLPAASETGWPTVASP
jgi:hypothetical protein